MLKFVDFRRDVENDDEWTTTMTNKSIIEYNLLSEARLTFEEFHFILEKGDLYGHGFKVFPIDCVPSLCLL